VGFKGKVLEFFFSLFPEREAGHKGGSIEVRYVEIVFKEKRQKKKREERERRSQNTKKSFEGKRNFQESFGIGVTAEGVQKSDLSCGATGTVSSGTHVVSSIIVYLSTFSVGGGTHVPWIILKGSFPILFLSYFCFLIIHLFFLPYVCIPYEVRERMIT
jgi:hypothetical protein